MTDVVPTDRRTLGATFGRLAELAATGGDGGLEERIAVAVAALREWCAAGWDGPPLPAALVAAAGDTGRPLSRRVAVLAHLHAALSA